MKCPFELPVHLAPKCGTPLDDIIEAIHDKNNKLVASMIPPEFADYIVTACNCHEALVEAGKMGLELAQMLNHPNEHHIQAALAKAEVKK